MAYQVNATKRTKVPSEVFKTCPACGSSGVMAVDEEVFCKCCDWSSIATHAEVLVDAGHFDAALFEYEEGLRRSELELKKKVSAAKEIARSKKNKKKKSRSKSRKAPSLKTPLPKAA